MANRTIIKTLCKDLNGKLLCQWCFKYLFQEAKHDFCNENCRKEFKQRASDTQLRTDCFDRDKGICSSCKVDTDKLGQELEELRKTKLESEVSEYLLKLGFHPNAALWEADHITPIALGGNLGLENIQTLCYRCHRGKTSEQNNASLEEPDLLSCVYELMYQSGKYDDDHDTVSPYNLELAHKTFTRIKQLEDFKDKVSKILNEDLKRWSQAFGYIQNYPEFADNWPQVLQKAISKL